MKGHLYIAVGAALVVNMVRKHSMSLRTPDARCVCHHDVKIVHRYRVQAALDAVADCSATAAA